MPALLLGHVRTPQPRAMTHGATYDFLFMLRWQASQRTHGAYDAAENHDRFLVHRFPEFRGRRHRCSRCSGWLYVLLLYKKHTVPLGNAQIKTGPTRAHSNVRLQSGAACESAVWSIELEIL